MTTHATTEFARIRAETPADDDAIEALAAEAFGPGRFAKTAYRLRSGARPVPELCLVAELDGELVGSVRLFAIRVGDMPALLLGPLVVRPAVKGKGHGLALMRMAIALARQGGHRLVILVGDYPYYARVGFGQVPPGRVRLPGPVDPARLLYLELVEGAFEGVAGEARPDSAAFAVPGAGQGPEQQQQAEGAAHQGKGADAV